MSVTGYASESGSHFSSQTLNPAVKAFACGSVRTFRALRSMTARMIGRNAGISLANRTYGYVCADESRSHIAGMSPVWTYIEPSSWRKKSDATVWKSVSASTLSTVGVVDVPINVTLIVRGCGADVFGSRAVTERRRIDKSDMAASAGGRVAVTTARFAYAASNPGAWLRKSSGPPR